MELSAEERRKIYEEEKALREAEQEREQRKRQIDNYERSDAGRNRRIASSSFSIAWSIILLVFFYVFRHYLAYYQIEQANGASMWVRYEILTPSFNTWMPILTITLVVTIAAHIALLIYDKYIIRQGVIIGLDLLRILTVATLLSIFPFSFNSIPDMDGLVLTVLLKGILVTALVILVIAAMVNIIKFIIRLATRTAIFGSKD